MHPTVVGAGREAGAETPRSQGAAISYRGVSQVFVQGDRVVPTLLDLNVEIQPGEFVGIVGPSGCGKTTLIEMAAGLRPPTVGQVSLGGEPVHRPTADTAYMLARDALLPWRTVRANVELGLQVRGVPAKERHRIADEWLERVGLGDFANARITQLSQGMRQRVAIARTLSLTPRCILMDEPFAALDAHTRVLVQEEFMEHWERASRPTVLFVTHDLGEAILLCDRIIMLSRRPATVIQDIRITLPRPRKPTRDRLTVEYAAYFDTLWKSLDDDFSGTDANVGVDE